MSTDRSRADSQGSLFADTNPREAEQARARLCKLLASRESVTLEITPVLAGVMLERNTGNRPLSERMVRILANAMRSGDWRLTGEAIIFSDTGVLNDGQHRLMACVRAGVSFKSDVRFGIEREAFKFTDIGRKRGLSDTLGIVGEKRTTTLAATLNWLHRYQTGLPAAQAASLLPDQGHDLLSRHPDLRRSVEIGRRTHTESHLLQPSIAGFCHYLFSRRDPAKADLFFDRLASGLGLVSQTDPVLRLRQRLIQELSSRSTLDAVVIIALVIKAWNAFRSGRPTPTLRWISEGDNAEAFPAVE